MIQQKLGHLQVHVCKLNLSSLKKKLKNWVKENLSSSFCNLGAIVALLVFEIKFTIIAKTSHAPSPYDIFMTSIGG
jgi:hypothetical protein